MSTSLLEAFLSQECTPYVRQLIERTLADPAQRHVRLTFNRFEITIEREREIATLEDVLDATEAGIEQVPLAALEAALARASAS